MPFRKSLRELRFLYLASRARLRSSGRRRNVGRDPIFFIDGVLELLAKLRPRQVV
jgi:hypothetical protein